MLEPIKMSTCVKDAGCDEVEAMESGSRDEFCWENN